VQAIQADHTLAGLNPSARIADMDMSPKRPQKHPTARKLLAWYDKNRRTLPWRVAPGKRQDPYRVWLSEIMLQQTTATAVGPYYEEFLDKWPSLESLASASRDEVLTAWAGLGYYSRARHLHRCAQVLTEEWGGKFPTSEKELLTLPGVGAYTAAAIASIAFDRPAAVVDGNVERVMTRQFALTAPLPKVKAEVKALVVKTLSKSRPGDFAQAMMDLGATLCRPKSPRCDLCPWKLSCEAFSSGTMTSFPVKASKKKRPTRRGIAFRVVGPGGALLLEQRPEKGLLAAMWQVPCGPWEEVSEKAAFAKSEIGSYAPVEANWTPTSGLVTHTFTHFHLELAVYETKTGEGVNPKRGRFVARDELDQFAIPSVMQKVIKHAVPS
jgi:A/G-specific adenine glycosylase